jgi:hypothetical protein
MDDSGTGSIPATKLFSWLFYGHMTAFKSRLDSLSAGTNVRIFKQVTFGYLANR